MPGASNRITVRDGGHRVHERLQRLEAGADAVDQEQRDWPTGPVAYRNTHLLAADADELFGHLRPHWAAP